MRVERREPQVPGGVGDHPTAPPAITVSQTQTAEPGLTADPESVKE